MDDPTTTVIAWSAVSLIAGYLLGRFDPTRRAQIARPAWMRGMRFNAAGAPMARERPRRLPDDDKGLLAIKDEMQLAAERQAHRLHDRLTLDYWQAGVHVEFCPRLETVARFVAMPRLSRRKFWTGGNDTYGRLCAAFTHRGKVLQIAYDPDRFAWSRSWSTCRRRVAWFEQVGYRLPPPTEWGEASPTDD